MPEVERPTKKKRNCSPFRLWNADSFHCSLIPNQYFKASNQGSFNLTFTGTAFINPSDGSHVMADALNAGYHLKSALALPKGGPGGTGATDYVFVRGGSQQGVGRPRTLAVVCVCSGRVGTIYALAMPG